MYTGMTQPVKHPADLAAVLARATRSGVPRVMAAEVSMYVIAVKHSSIIIDIDLMGHETLVRMHCLDLDAVKAQYAAIWNDHLTFQFLSGKLHLYVPFLLRQLKHNLEEAEAGNTKRPGSDEILLKGITAACRMIEIYDTFITTANPVPGYKDHISFFTLPKNYFRGLCHAVCLLLKFLSHDLDPNVRLKSRQHVELAIASLRRSSPDPEDEPVRASKMFEKVFNDGEQLLRHSQSIAERGSGSIFWDVLHQSFRLRGRSTYRTDLLELIDPTRTVLDPPLQANEAEADIDMGSDAWMGSINELSDLGLLYLPETWPMDAMVT